MDSLFQAETDVLLDMNAPRYKIFKEDIGNYYDAGHLSYRGSEFVILELKRLLDDYYVRGVIR